MVDFLYGNKSNNKIMAQYIDKDALVAEIEKLENVLSDPLMKINGEDYINGGKKIIKEMKSFLNTLEVKEVDLEKEYKDFVEEDHVYNKLVNSIVGKSIAKHFFELGLSVNSKA